MREDVVIGDGSASLRIFSGVGAFVIYFLILLLLIGGFQFYRESVRYGDVEPNLAEIINESIELSDVMPQNPAPKEDTPKENMAKDSLKETPQADPILATIPKKPEPIQKPQEPKQSQKEIIAPAKDIEKEKEAEKEREQKAKELDLAEAFSTISSETKQEKSQRRRVRVSKRFC